MKNLLFRVLTALVLLPLVVAAFLIGGMFLTLLLAIVALWCSFEVAGIILPHSKRGFVIAISSWIGLFLPIFFSNSLPQVASLVSISFILINILFLFDKKIDAGLFEKIGAIFYFSAYCFLGLACLYWLQNEELALNRSDGLGFVFLACIATWGNDTCAYFGGRLFGKHPLFMRVSAKKTWEGFIAGSIGGIGFIYLLDFIFQHFFATAIFGALSSTDFLAIGLVAIVLAPLGDLIESRLKRLYEIKDSSNILPGHGGILDRIDGLIFVLPWTALYAFIIRPLW